MRNNLCIVYPHEMSWPRGQKTVTSDRAQAIAKETGALVYWQGAEDSAARVAKDIETVARIGAMLN